MRSVQPAAFQDAGIFRAAVGRRRDLRLRGGRDGRGWRDRCCRRGSCCWRSGRFLSACLNRSGGRLLCGRRTCRILRALAVRNEFRVARSAGTRRDVVGQSAGPMRPMICDIAAAACETQSKAEQGRRREEPPVDHIRCRTLRLARSLHRTPSNTFFNRAAFNSRCGYARL
jgi:hypothetical protein